MLGEKAAPRFIANGAAIELNAKKGDGVTLDAPAIEPRAVVWFDAPAERRDPRSVRPFRRRRIREAYDQPEPNAWDTARGTLSTPNRPVNCRPVKRNGGFHSSL